MAKASADLYNVEFIVISSLGPSATAIISPLRSLPLYSFHIGHFAEGDGEHYVKLQNDPVCQNLDVRSADNNDTSFKSPEEEGVFNIDVQKKIIMWTLAIYPYMRQILRAVSRLFKYAVDRQPLPRVHLPELSNVADIKKVSMKKIMAIKGKCSGEVIRLREIINSVKWASAWLSLKAAGMGWYGISHIYWNSGKK